jgi:hypothetical protein
MTISIHSNSRLIRESTQISVVEASEPKVSDLRETEAILNERA